MDKSDKIANMLYEQIEKVNSGMNATTRLSAMARAANAIAKLTIAKTVYKAARNELPEIGLFTDDGG